MKNMIKTVILTSGICLSLSADIFKVGSDVFKSPKSYDESKIGFELYNKSPKRIWIGLKSGRDLTQVPDVVEPGKIQRYQNDISLPTQLYIWYADPGVVIGKEKAKGTFGQLFERLASGAAATLSYDKAYDFSKGKTIYVTWDKEKFLRPQTGPLGGILNKTDSGLSLKRNVDKSDIKEK